MKKFFKNNISLLIQKTSYLLMLFVGFYFGVLFVDYKELLTGIEGFEGYSMMRKIMAYGVYRSFEPLFIMKLLSFVIVMLFIIILSLKVIKKEIAPGEA